jgi:5-methylthioribose kinase
LKNKYITENQALLHGNLHTGSILVSSGKTVVLGPTCAVYGPMGFDTGSFIANLLLNYVSQTVLSSRADGVINSDGNYGEWVLSEVNVFWETFCSEFLNLWNDQFEHTGDAFQRVLLHGKSSTTMPLHFAKDEFLSELLEDTLGFAGIEMLRRLFGSAHVEDLECIGEVELRVQCERHGLEIAKELIKNASKFKSINVVTMMACDKQRYMWGVPDENIDEKIEGDCAILTGLSMSFSTLEDGINFNKPIQYSDLDKNPTAISFSDDEEHECINVGPVEV